MAPDTVVIVAPPPVADVIIVGGGPCGLMLANELGRRNVGVVLLDDKPGTAFNPQANATQARTMEHFRRLGIAEEIRALGLPADFPTDIAYFTRFARHELARFPLPSAREAKQRVGSLGGSWSAAELPHRVSQKYVEATLRRHADKLPGVSLNYGWRLVAFHEEEDQVVAEVERVADGARRVVRGRYIVGADGPRSAVRQQMGWRYAGESGIQRDFMGGRMVAVYVRCPAFYDVVPHAPAWMNVSFNGERRAFMAAVDGKGEFAFHTQLRAGEREEDVTEERALAMFRAAVGVDVPADILSQGTWTAGHCLVAETFQQGRVFIGGDAAHLFTPTGGLGYNTAVEDAVNLGWKLAAVIRGTAAATLLDTYEQERRPLAIRNTGYARGFADSLGLFSPSAGIEDDGPEAEQLRAQAGAYLSVHGRMEFNIPGITFGGRNDGSRAVISDGTHPPPDAANSYIPSACPGGRAPHIWLSDSVSLYDRFGFEWTLLRLGGPPGNAEALKACARARSLPLTVLELDNAAARELYGADLVLVRPDQIVAWRGDESPDAASIYAQLLGAAATPPRPQEGQAMRTVDENTITQAVIESLTNCKDARQRTILTSLVQHLHDFAREVQLTESEWFAGIKFLTDAGHMTGDKRQEFILLSDTLGLSMLVMAQNNKRPSGCTESTVFGPFFVEGAPRVENGSDIANGAVGEPCFVRGTVACLDGAPVADAQIDVWQSDANGRYDVQYAERDTHRARARLTTRADGSFDFRSVVAVPYPIPDDGPVGRMLDSVGRHPWRPAHLHFMIEAPGCERLITHIFRSDSPYLDSDAVFGVRTSLVQDWVRHEPGPAPDGSDCPVPFYTLVCRFVLNRSSSDGSVRP